MTKYDQFICKMRQGTIENKIIWYEIDKKCYSKFSQNLTHGYYFPYNNYKIILGYHQIDNEKQYVMMITNIDFCPLKFFYKNNFTNSNNLMRLFEIVNEKIDDIFCFIDQIISE